jgi:hypothetical protein
MVAGAVLVVAGLSSLVTTAAARTATSSSSWDQVDGVILRTGNGEVAVTAADVTAITIERVEHYAFRRPDARAEVRGTTLEMDDGCPGWWPPLIGTCRVDYLVTMPPGTSVEVDTSNGDVAVTGVAGDVRVDTSNGKVLLVAVGGDVVVHSSNGSIDGRDLTAPTAHLDTSNGSITLVFATAPDTVTADSSNGDVTVELPEGVYRVLTSTGNGDVDVAVTTDPDSARLIEVETSNGDVTIRRR